MAEMSNEKKLKILIAGTGIAIIFLVIIFASSQYSKSPNFCVSCHAVEPQFEAWQQSSHSTIACVKCHNTPGIFKIFGDKDWSRKTVQFTAQLWQGPVKILSPIENEVCLRCHSENREATPSGDLIIPHDRHQQKNIRCVACHQGVVHGENKNIEVMQARQLDDKPSDSNHPVILPKTNMNDCLDCHVQRKVTIACEACHTDIVRPTSHEQADFDTNHGLQAMENVNNCNKCHAYSFSNQGVEKEQDLVKKYARGNVFCYNCHQKRPLEHDGEWLGNHPYSSKQNKDGCLICHSETKPKTGEKVTKTYCNVCHQESHEAGWKGQHSITVKQEGTAKNKCFDCHTQSQCYNCHTGRR